ncbi:MAG: hypothetical protein ACI85U_001886 [Candidatus Promineifilaceae bacterium]
MEIRKVFCTQTNRMNELLDKLTEYFSEKRGLLPMIGIALIILNFVLQIFPGNEYWIVASNLLMHVGLVVSIIGILLIRPLQ